VLTNASIDAPAWSGRAAVPAGGCRTAAPVTDRRRAQLHGTGVPAVRLLGSAVDVRGGALPVAMPALPVGVREDQRTTLLFATALTSTALTSTALITTPGTTLGNHSPGRPQS
jgi:hypothetical protein